MEGPNQEKGSKICSCIEIPNTKTYQRAHSDRKRGPFRVLAGAGAPVPAAHPVAVFFCASDKSKLQSSFRDDHASSDLIITELVHFH